MNRAAFSQANSSALRVPSAPVRRVKIGLARYTGGDAGLARGTTPSKSPARLTGSQTVPSRKVNRVEPARWSMFAIRPVDTSSRQTTVSPRAINRSHRCDPRNPAPPVTRTRLPTPLQLSSLSVGLCVAHTAVSPSRVSPPLRVEAIAPIDDVLGSRHRAELVRVQFLEFVPLGQDQDHIGAVARVHQRRRIVKRGEELTGVFHRLRVVHAHARTLQLYLAGHVECRRITDVVRIGFERGAQDRGSGPEKRAAHLARHLHDTAALSHIDVVDFMKNRRRVTDAQLAGARHERSNVFRETAAAETQAGVEKRS